MKSKFKKCARCGTYTLREKCPECGSETMNVAPAGFSLPDRYGKYRRMMKRRLDQLKNEGH